MDTSDVIMHLKNGDIVQHTTEKDVFGIIYLEDESYKIRYIIINRPLSHYMFTSDSYRNILEEWKKVI